jgi:hypothetical protein
VIEFIEDKKRIRNTQGGYYAGIGDESRINYQRRFEVFVLRYLFLEFLENFYIAGKQSGAGAAGSVDFRRSAAGGYGVFVVGKPQIIVSGKIQMSAGFVQIAAAAKKNAHVTNDE